MSEKLIKTQKYLRIYNIVMILLYICSVCFYGLYFFFLQGLTQETNGEESAIIFAFIALIFGVIFLGFIIFFAVAFLTVNKPKNYAFFIQIISLAIGCTSIITIIPCVMLLIDMFKPEVKDFYFPEK